MSDTLKRAGDYHIEVHDSPGGISADAWDDLLAQQSHPTPFMQHRYLLALEQSGSAVARTGWQAQFVSVHQGQRLVAAAPAYLKAHSWGEYVFDWAWAEAYQRHGLPYYPKLLVACPFTPVPGSRLLASDDAARAVLGQSLLALAQQSNLSSVHLLFATDAERAVVQQQGWMARAGVQFHWQNRPQQPWLSFEEFLGDLQRDKRKKIQQERRKVSDAGVHFEVREGRDIREADWDFFYECHQRTYAAHGGSPYLTRAFFQALADTQAEHWLMFVARLGSERVATSLLAIDRQQGVAWGRYWGSTQAISCLHFEACYYQPLAWCIANGFQRFEGGAQGEHKIARGLLPSPTGSAHWLAHPAFASAVADFLARERGGMDHYLDELNDRSPLKRSATD